MRILIIICCLAFAKAGLSQTTLSHQVIGSLGGTSTSGNLVMEQSLGDLVIVSSNAGDDIASGFQQGRKYIDYIYESSSWRPKVPEANATFIDNFFIRSTGPVLGSDINIKNISIEGAYSLGLGGFHLFFKGDIASQNGIIENGTLHFVGDDTELNRLYSNGITVDSFVQEGPDEFVLEEEMKLKKLFTMKDGNLNTGDGNLLFLSTSSNTAEITPYEGGGMTGSARVQRFIPAKRAFRFLASSVNTSSSILENWQENRATSGGFGTHITGSASGANGFDINATGNASMFDFDNTAQSWAAIPNTDVDGLNVGKAYRVMVRGDRNTDLTNTAATASPTILQAKGTMDLGPHEDNTLSLVAGQFNFIANPYQATVQMNTVLQGSNNINENLYYIWDPTINSRGAYVTVLLPSGNNIAGSVANEYLQPSQAAFVTTLNNTTAASPTAITFNQDDIVNGNQTLIFSTPNVDFSIVGKLQNNIPGQPMQLMDAFGIFMDGQYANNIDSLDALSIGNLDETISIVSNNTLLNIEFRDVPGDMDIIPLNHTSYRHTSYNYLLQIEAIPAGREVYLKDNFLNVSQRLNEGNNNYSFVLDAGLVDSSGPDRFHLYFTATTLNEDPAEALSSFEFYPNPVNDVVNISWNNFNGSKDEALSYTLINTLGQVIRAGALDFTGSNTATITDLGNLASGSYYIELSYNGTANTIQIIKE
jgi:hypothetical protein